MNRNNARFVSVIYSQHALFEFLRRNMIAADDGYSEGSITFYRNHDSPRAVVAMVVHADDGSTQMFFREDLKKGRA